MDSVEKLTVSDWENMSSSHWLENPKLSKKEQALNRMALESCPNLEGIIWIRSSGTTRGNKVRWVALKKTGLLKSAASVNSHLKITSDDIWLSCLPQFHVGGLAIVARAYLSQSQVIDMKKWDPLEFTRNIQESQISLSALVPAQVFDLVHNQCKAPSSIRAIVVGGDALSVSLYSKARELGWPLLPSYGATETGSQVATANLDSLLNSKEFPKLKILEHFEVTVEKNQIHVDVSEIYSGELLCNGSQCHWVPLTQTKLNLTDLGDREGDFLKVIGRESSLLKILGEKVSLTELNETLFNCCLKRDLNINNFCLFVASSSRKGNQVFLVSQRTSAHITQKLLEQFNEQVNPYEKLEGAFLIDEIPKTYLGKIKAKKLQELIF